VTIICKQRG